MRTNISERLSTAQQPYPDFKPFRRWIELHATPDFGAFVNGLREDLDEQDLSAHEEARLQRQFQRAVEYEVRFWEMAYGDS
ncbi:MAG: hypothetical protein DIU76_00725 [Bacillota bacterium]|nr:MAG: hypothetical protein DIU76_00725 [Bacillota bacterium]